MKSAKKLPEIDNEMEQILSTMPFGYDMELE